MKQLGLSLCILLAMMLVPLPVICAQQGMIDLLFEAKCDKHAGAITGALAKGDYIGAIVESGEYERMLNAQYPPSTYSQGVFRSPAHHLSLRFTASAWTQVDPKETPIPTMTQNYGVEYPLVLENPKNGHGFLLMLAETGLYGMKRGGADNIEINEQALLAYARMTGMARMIKSHVIKTVGNQRVLAVALDADKTVPAMMYLLDRGGHVYVFILATPRGSFQLCDDMLTKIVKGANFHYQPANTMIIAQIKKQLTDPQSIPQLLACSKELAFAGEFDAAKTTLKQLRGVIGGLIPKPVVEDDVASYAAYQLKVYNPDPARWGLSVLPMKTPPYGILLSDQSSDGQAGMAVLALNIVQDCGPTLALHLTRDTDGALQQLFYSSAGRAFVQASGYTLMSEDVGVFKGLNTYESLGSRKPDASMKCLLFTRATNLYFVYMYGPRAHFDTRAAEYEALLARSLVFTTN